MREWLIAEYKRLEVLRDEALGCRDEAAMRGERFRALCAASLAADYLSRQLRVMVALERRYEQYEVL